MSSRSRFLTAQWRNLAMLNYEIDPGALISRVPRGCELDTWEGRTYLSVIGFQFLDTRILGVPVPFHRNFEEVNLRFYVRRKAGVEWRRGVVFIKELVPRAAIAWVARWVYNENYVALPMRHVVRLGSGNQASRAVYRWRRRGLWEELGVEFSGEPSVPPEDAVEAFITEHYWGYAKQLDGSTMEYRVEHPRWGVWSATSASLECDGGTLYGPEFAESLSVPPRSAFVADGSPVVVHRGVRLA